MAQPFLSIYCNSAHRRRRCGVGYRGCCRGENHLRMSAPPVRCRLLALEYKPRSSSPARPPRRHDFARHRTDCQPPNSGHTCLLWGSLWLSKQPHKLFNTIKIVRIIFTHHLLCGISRAVAVRYPCSRVVQRICELELPLCFAFPLRGNSHLHHRRFRRRAAPSAPLVPYDAIRRIRVGWRSCTVTKPFANRSAVCPVLLRPELHLRRFHRRRCRHIRGALQFREFFASDVGSRFAHATAFNATYQQTPELPENHPTIVGSVWEQEILFSVDGHPFLHSRRCGAMSCG